MVFSSVTFLYYFLPIVIILYFSVPKKAKNLVLFALSLVFYAWGEPIYVFLMLFSTAFNFWCGLKIEKYEYVAKKKRYLLIGIIVDIAILFFFKYANFALDIVNNIFKSNIGMLSLALPIGISFYTFQTMSYIIDVYRNEVCAQKNFISFGTYVALFPQLIAGPIVRYNTIENQLAERSCTYQKAFEGIVRFTVGLSKKVLIANNIGAVWNYTATRQTDELSVLMAWLGALAYAMQIYYDFSGYSDMAIGLGKIFGFEFDENFNYPYISKSISEFWRRWHISLGTWFKEYVYFPLGGSRCGKLRTYLNIFVVWLLTGLWHGASLNFVVWGLYYCILLIAEKLFLIKKLKAHSIVAAIYTFIAVIVGWVVFASDNLLRAFEYLGVMIGIGASGFADGEFVYQLGSNIFVLIISALFATPFAAKIFIAKRSGAYKAVLVILLLTVCTAYLINSSYNPFLYFRF